MNTTEYEPRLVGRRYVDHVPTILGLCRPNGLFVRCSCTKRCYDTKRKFETHCLTDKHSYWLSKKNLKHVTNLLDSQSSEEFSDRRITRLQLKLAKAKKERDAKCEEVDSLTAEQQKLEKTCSRFESRVTTEQNVLKGVAKKIEEIHQQVLSMIDIHA